MAAYNNYFANSINVKLSQWLLATLQYLVTHLLEAMARHPTQVMGHGDVIPCCCREFPSGLQRASPPSPPKCPGAGPPGTGKQPAEPPDHAAPAARCRNLPGVLPTHRERKRENTVQWF